MTNPQVWLHATARRVRERLKKKRNGYFYVWSRAMLTQWRRHVQHGPDGAGIDLVTLDGLPARANGATFRELVPPAVAPTPPPGWAWPEAFHPKPELTAARGQGVIEIPDGVVFGTYGHFGTDAGGLIADRCALWPGAERAALGNAVDALANGMVPLEGVTVCAWINGANYAHCLLQSVPRLELFRRAFGLEADRFLVGQGQHATLEALAVLGIAADRVALVPPRGAAPAYRCETLRAATSIDVWDYGVEWSAAFLHEMFLPEPPEPEAGRRLYIRRGVARRAVLNEDDVIAALEPWGFEVVTMSGRTVAEQAAMFAGASAIVASHGAAMSNLVFARPGTKVVELMGTNTATGHFAVLAWRRGLEYRMIMGTEPAPTPRWRTWRSDADTRVDLPAMRRCLEGLDLH